MIDLTDFIKAVLALLATVITCFVIPWIRAHTTAQQQATLRALVKAGVYAAEQVYEGDGRGKEKMQYVKTFLAARGYTVSEAEIEAAVAEYINFPLPVAVVTEEEE